MSAATTHDANPFLSTQAAIDLLVDLRKTTDGRTGDRLSQAVRAVTQFGSGLSVDEVDAAIAAIALLLTEHDPTLLDGAADEEALRRWLRNVDTELTPGRHLAASAALARIELNLDNTWYQAQQQAGRLPAALLGLHRLRDRLNDVAAG